MNELESRHLMFACENQQSVKLTFHVIATCVFDCVTSWFDGYIGGKYLGHSEAM